MSIKDIKEAFAGKIANVVVFALVAERSPEKKYRNASETSKTSFYVCLADPSGFIVAQVVSAQLTPIYKAGKTVRIMGDLMSDGTMLTLNGVSETSIRNSESLKIPAELLSSIPSLQNLINNLEANKPASPLKTLSSMPISLKRALAPKFDIEAVIVKKRMTSTVPVSRNGQTELVQVMNARLRDATGVAGCGFWRSLASEAAKLPTGTAVRVTNVTVGEFENQRTVSTTGESEIKILPPDEFKAVPVEDIVPDDVGTLITIEGLKCINIYPRCSGPKAGCRKRMVVKISGDLLCECCEASVPTNEAALGIAATVTIMLEGKCGQPASIYNDGIGEILSDYVYDSMRFDEFTTEALFDMVADELPITARVNLTRRDGLIISEIYNIMKKPGDSQESA